MDDNVIIGKFAKPQPTTAAVVDRFIDFQVRLQFHIYAGTLTLDLVERFERELLQIELDLEDIRGKG